MIKCFFGILFTIVLSAGNAQQRDNFLIPFNAHHKWGFTNEHGDILIQPTFDSVAFFTDGFAEAYRKDKKGLINQKGQWVVQPDYYYINVLDSAKKLYDVTAQFIHKDSSIDLRSGIYKQGKGLLTPLNYYSVKEHGRNMYALEGSNGKNYLFDLTTKKITLLKNHPFLFDCGCVRSHIRQRREKVTYAKYLRTRPPLEELNTMHLFRVNNKLGAYFIVDTTYDVRNKKWILYADTIPPIYDTIVEADHTDGKLFYVMSGNKWGVADHTGKTIIDANFDAIKKKGYEHYFEVRLNDKYGLYNLAGKAMFDCEQEAVLVPCEFSDKYIAAKKNQQWRIKNKRGDYVSDKSFDTLKFDCNWRNEYLIVQQQGRFGVLDSNGTFVEPAIYEDLIFKDSFVIYKTGGLYGVKNLKNKAFNIQPEWDDIRLRQMSYFQVKKNNQYGVLLPYSATARLLFPISGNDSFDFISATSIDGNKTFYLVGITENGTYFFVGENGHRFTDK